MSYSNKLGDNIRCIRVAYGETQEQLGSIIGVEKTTISQYENGKREPSRDILSAIAEHYMISIEELTKCDFSIIDKIAIDRTVFWKEIDAIFPAVATEKALSNAHFKMAYQLHHKFFDGIKRLSLDNCDVMGDCIEEYFLAYEEDSTLIEAVANLWGIMILTQFMLTTPQIAKKKPAPLMQIMARDKKIERLVEEQDASFEREAGGFLQDFRDPEFTEEFAEMKTIVKKSHLYSEIADYYLALEYCFNIVDNELGHEFNQRIGIEMMRVFENVDNPYAAHFFMFQQRSMGMRV